MKDPTLRFSSRVENYVRYRPGYPAQIIDILRRDCQFGPESLIADIGSGTGKLAELFLRAGSRVTGVEPNADMRAAGERFLAEFPGFTSVAATAEETTLADGSVDFVAAGQAFHWFDQERARAEFQRILRPNGWVVLIWNDRPLEGTVFLAEYEQLLVKYGTDYAAVKHRDVDLGAVQRFAGSGEVRVAQVPNSQTLDFEGLRGRLLSSSYTPEPGDPKYEPMLNAVRLLYERHQAGGSVRFKYTTVMYSARLARREDA